MIGTQLGPYRICSDLGSGGMGKVYLAENTDLSLDAPEEERRVALKVVHPHLMETPGFFKRFLLEAELGKRVRHENVVRTFDVDTTAQEGGQHHYMVMEYVKGKSLRELLVELGTVPETLLREVALQTAAGLAAIHAEGIVHRDIKPENILITEDHEIRIMDLGVAKLQEATIALTKEGQFAGSLLYAAPEQFKQEPVGPLADLYSLGVLLYELATGRNPFRGDDSAAVIAAHLSEVPPRACDSNEDLSLFFSELVGTLLAKRVTDRFASASELHTVLDEAEQSAWWIGRVPALQKQVARMPKLRVRRDTKLHGRDEVLAVIRSLFEQATMGLGNTVYVEGEAGIGKTRLIDALLRGMEVEDFHVLYGAYPPSGGMGALSNAVIANFGEAHLADALAPYLTVTPRLVPAFAALLKHEGPPTGSEPLGGDALHTIVVHLMQALAAEKPTIWIVDDLHFAPQESLGFLLAMARAVEDHRILLVVTGRPGVAMEEFSRLPNFQRLGLSRLGGRDIVRLLGDAFRSEDLAEKLAGKIAVKSDGVPFFIFEMIRGLKEGQFIRQQPDGTYMQTQVIDAIEVPSAVKDLIEGRLRGLNDDDRNVLDVAAVIGMEFESGLVAAVLGLKRVHVLQRLAAIERQSGVVRAEGGRYRFDHNQIQEVLYTALSDELKSEYHTLLAEAFSERCGSEPIGDAAVFLVSHHLRGNRPLDARPHLDAAFEQLARGYRNDALLDLIERALGADGMLGGRERVAVLLRYAACLNLLGRRTEQRAALDEASALVDKTDDGALRAKVRQALGALLHVLSENDAALAVLEEAREEARAAGDRELEARTIGNLGNVFRHLGRPTDAVEHHELSRALSREIGYRLGEAVATGNLGAVFNDLGRSAEAQDHFERARALNREIGNRQGEAIATGNLGNVFSDLGRYAEAQAHYQRHRALSREIGFRLGESIATANLGNIFMSLGRYAEAREHHERARALFREIGYRIGEAISTGNLGNVVLGLGRPDEARRHYERLRILSLDIGYRQGEGDAIGGLARVAEAEEDVETAYRLHEEALAVRRELGEKPSIAETLIALGRLDGARGETRAAAAHLDEALALAREATNPEAILFAAVEQAHLPKGDVEAALAAFAEHEEHIGCGARMAAHFRVWELTKHERHLKEGWRLLEHLRDHAPEDCRISMIESVPLHRDIARAWAEHRPE